MDELVLRYKLQKCFPYLDDITIAGMTKEELEKNVNSFLKVATLHGLTLNEGKCAFSKTSIRLLGYEISHNKVSPDSDRLQGLKSLNIPVKPKELERLKDMLAYYAKWIKNYSEKISVVSKATLPLSEFAINRVKSLIDELSKVTLRRIDSTLPFVIETDASYGAIAATLSQNSKPVAFFSRTLNNSERNHSSVEKVAYAIVESVRKWNHLLLGKLFTIITDQKSVSFMFDEKHSSNVKNDKIARWRIELMPYKYDIIYRKGAENIPADTLSRQEYPDKRNLFSQIKGFNNKRYKRKVKNVKHINVVTGSDKIVKRLHSDYGHPGVTRMWDLVKRLNFAVSLEEVRKVCSECSVCSQLKPTFRKPITDPLISAMNPMDRLSIDFKGPLPNTYRNNRFLFIAVDEYSRFPFAFPCKNINLDTVLECLGKIFSFCGTPKYIHSDRGSAFMSQAVKEFLLSRNVASSHSTPYHPTGNSQCEKYVGIIWKTIMLNLKDREMIVSEWDKLIDISLDNIRSLTNTVVNEVPHSRFFSFNRRVLVRRNCNSKENDQRYMYLRKFVKGKYDPLVQQVEILNHNPQYSEIKYADGKVDRVSNKDLSRCPSPSFEGTSYDLLDSDNNINDYLQDDSNLPPLSGEEPPPDLDPAVRTPDASSDLSGSGSPRFSHNNAETDSHIPDTNFPVLRKSNRTSKPPLRYESIDYRK